MYTKWLDLLKQVELFQNMDEEGLNVMLNCLSPQIVSYKKKEYITLEGHEFTGIGIIVQGEVIVTKENVAGDRVIMSKLREGHIFGEVIAFSDQNLWVATVVASTDCTVLFLAPSKILGNCPAMCGEHKLLIQNMLKIVSQKTMDLNRKIEYLAIKSIRKKVSTYLLENYNMAHKMKFKVPLKRNELADFLNVSRPSLSRELIKMKEEGIIDFDKSLFTILDIENLKACI